MKTQKLLRTLSLCALALLLGVAKSSAAPPVIMKVLVLAGSASEPSYQSITSFLAQIGVPYQAVILSNLTPNASGNRMPQVSLSNTATGQGLYQGIIVTDSTFAACGSSCLSTADWTTLNTYATEFSVRIASYYTDPAAQWGLVPVGTVHSYTAASPLNVTLTAAGAAVFPYLNTANAIPVAGQGTSAVKAYLATTTAAANETTTALLTSGANTVGVTHTTAAGQEILALTMDNAPTLTHSFAFGYGVINWVTKGMFLGSRKVYLNNETDDLLLGNWEYAPSQHPACEGPNTCPTYFETGPDLKAFASWQTNLQTDPLFQAYRQTFAINGVGTTWFASNDPIFAAMKSLNSQFWWLSHTWDHPNLDCYSTSKSGACVAANSSQSLSELNQNISTVPSLGVTFDETSMVTPFNSGLTNTAFLQAAAQVGIKYIVDPALPATPNTGIASAVPSILFVTRLNSDLYYDVSSPLSGANGSWPDEYNAQYGPDGTNPAYSQNQTYSQILDNLSTELLQINVYSYSPYVIESHIANVATYDGTHSVFTDLMDAMVTKYEKVFNLPVLSLNLENIGALMQARTAYNNSGVVGVYTPGVSVVLTTTNAATIPVTGLCSQSTCGTYGGQIQDNVVMAAGSTVTIPLTANVGVSLSSVAVQPASVSGGTSATGTVTLSGAAPTGGVSVSLASSSTSATVAATVTVPAGSTTATFNVATSTVTTSTSATLTASYSGVSKTAALTITPSTTVALSSVAVNPTSVTGGTSVTGTVTLSAAAPTGGVSVALASSSTSATVPASVTVAAGSTTATFTVTTIAVTSSTSATLTATYNSVSKTAALTIAPSTTVALSSVAVNPTSVTGGTSVIGTVTLSAAAPTGGVSVALASSSTSATVPASVTVAAGSTTATFTVTTTAVTSSASATLTATYSSVSKTAALTISPATAATLSSIALTPTSIASFSSVAGTITLSAAAPTGGVSVALSSNSSAATVPASVTVAAGSTTAAFTVTTQSVAYTTSVTITGTYSSVSKTAVLSVTPAATVALSSVSVNPTSVVNQLSATGTVTINTPAPTGGIVIELWTTGAIAYVPSSVTIAAGATTASFTVTTNYTTTSKQDTVTAFYNGVSTTATITVTP